MTSHHQPITLFHLSYGGFLGCPLRSLQSQPLSCTTTNLFAIDLVGAYWLYHKSHSNSCRLQSCLFACSRCVERFVRLHCRRQHTLHDAEEDGQYQNHNCNPECVPLHNDSSVMQVLCKFQLPWVIKYRLQSDKLSALVGKLISTPIPHPSAPEKLEFDLHTTILHNSTSR